MIRRLFTGWRILWWVVLAFPAVAYASFPWWAGLALARALTTTGVTLEALEIRHPGLTRLRIDSVAVRGHGAVLQLATVDVDYDWDSLWAARAKHIAIAAASAELPPTDAAVAGAAVEPGVLLLGLPRRLESVWAAIPADSAELGAFTLTAPTLTAQGTARLTAQALQIAGSGADFELFAHVRRGGGVNVRLLYAENSATLQLAPDARSGSVAVDWALEHWRVAGSCELSVDVVGWQLGSGLRLTSRQQPFTVEADLLGARGGWDADEPEVTLTAEWGVRSATELGVVAAAGELSARVHGTTAKLELAADTALRSQRLTAADIVVEDLHVRLPAATELTLDIQKQRLRADDLALMVSAGSTTWAEYVVGGALHLDILDLMVDSQQLSGRWRARGAELPWQGDGGARLAFADLAWALDGAVEQTVVEGLLARLLRAPMLDYDLDGGRIDVTFEAQGRAADSYAVTADVLLDDLSASYSDIPIVGARGALQFRADTDGWRLTAPNLSARGVDVGFPIRELGATLALDDSLMLTVENAQAKALGGTLAVAALSYDVVAGNGTFPVQIEALELAEVLALEGDTITGSAVLDGSLPVVIVDAGVSVTEGRLSARSPGGVLRYLGAQTAAESLAETGVGFAIAALADFRFDLLEVGVDYAVNGDLLLAVRLQGFNPAFEAGRPIHYNLNVSESIPALLRSLQLSDEFGRRLEQQLVE